MPYRFDFAPIWANRDLILEGLLTTIALSALGLCLALIVGVIVGTAGASRRRALRAAAAAYVEVMRNIPLLIHMYVWYVGLAFLRLPPFWCAAAALTLYSGAYVAETVRAGLNAVPRGQALAALATGLTPMQALRHVVYPQALRIITPSLASLASQLIKDSSLASVITVAELTYQASAIEGQTFRTFEIYITISALYLALVTLVTWSLTLIGPAREPHLQGFGDA
jgi:His/Glu/Gln/Arg/opine family amino acid ABC transporter permease subunit